MANNEYSMETVRCPLCGKNDYSIVIEQAKELYNGFDDYFDLVQCSQCDMVWTNPRPTAATIGYFYPDSAGYFKPHENIPTPTGALWNLQSTLKTAFLFKKKGYPSNGKKIPILASLGYHLLMPYLHRRSRLMHIPKWVDRGKLLDIGCAWGGYLLKMRDLGWEVEGIEPNEASATYARDKLGISVRGGLIDEISLGENGTYDVIHGSMVLEHVHEPKVVLNKIHKALKVDGQLILSIPDFAGLEARIFSRHAYTLQVPQHLNHFTSETINALLEDSGFKVNEIVHHHFERDWIASMMYSKCCPLVYRVITNSIIRKIVVKPLVYIQGVLGKTSRMSVFASPR